MAGGTECGRTSLTSTGAMTSAAGLLSPGEPRSRLLGRQLAFIPQVLQSAFSFTMTSEKPSPSVIGYHWLS